MSDLVVYGRLDELQVRVARLESAVAALAEAAGIPLPDGVAAPEALEADPVTAEIVELLTAGKRSKAVSLAAKKLGLGLQEATVHVGRIEGSL